MAVAQTTHVSHDNKRVIVSLRQWGAAYMLFRRHVSDTMISVGNYDGRLNQVRLPSGKAFRHLELSGNCLKKAKAMTCWVCNAFIVKALLVLFWNTA
jgi:hypothetical protein